MKNYVQESEAWRRRFEEPSDDVPTTTNKTRSCPTCEKHPTSTLFVAVNEEEFIRGLMNNTDI